ncbi:hypothetical protein DW287_09015, partial [Haemophilus influenzae]
RQGAAVRPRRFQGAAARLPVQVGPHVKVGLDLPVALARAGQRALQTVHQFAVAELAMPAGAPGLVDAPVAVHT